jgi:hypothetical protein
MEDLILEIGIDSEERLYVKPSKQSFPMIYREAMEVNWNPEQFYLFGAKPRKWSYPEWFQQIISAASIQGTKLMLNKNTKWVNIPSDLQHQITNKHHT